jgi:uncharacterized protein (DUF362 family)/ferredoxin
VATERDGTHAARARNDATSATPPQVSVVRCDGYEPGAVVSALGEVLAPWGGMSAFVSPGERVALKPNLLLAAAPERGITTHPAVMAGLAAQVRAAGASPVLVESPGAGLPNSVRLLERVYRSTGMADLERRGLLELSRDLRVKTVSWPSGRSVKRLDLLLPLAPGKAVISVSKLKTHTYMTFTGAVKNLFGAVPGLAKAGYHAKLPDPARFADMLLDVALAVGPRLHVMDGIVGLEGNGPGTGGRPRAAGLLLASPDPVALDAVACGLVRLPLERVPTLVAARERGLWSGRLQDVELLGGEWEELWTEAFQPPVRAPDPTGFARSDRISRVLTALARDAFNPRPVPRADRCTGCNSCVRACPVGAMRPGRSTPIVDDRRCTRCFCCHEFCPDAAIELERSQLGRVAGRLGLM